MRRLRERDWLYIAWVLLVVFVSFLNARGLRGHTWGPIGRVAAVLMFVQMTWWFVRRWRGRARSSS